MRARCRLRVVAWDMAAVGVARVALVQAGHSGCERGLGWGFDRGFWSFLGGGLGGGVNLYALRWVAGSACSRVGMALGVVCEVML